ncbi:MAG: hypothetical protein KAS48_02960 [Gammaproteobacteria bacterium]|nr:hypothetical protein [Gammaproteobacteria bacterium]MCK5092667.1 hypothetical protein [Gammaproteobacteria bacterium]
MNCQLLLFAIILGFINVAVSAVENTPPASAIENNEVCIDCHHKQDGELVESWRASAHVTTEPVTTCINCHGNLHKEVADMARRDQACIICHGGEKDPVVHSYSSSKHGTLMRLEEKQQDWGQPLKLANYRVPGCSYCHMHSGNHNISNTVRQNLMEDPESEEVQDLMQSICWDCHSPRYISRLFSNGEAMLEIARKKFREASEVIGRVENEFTDDDLLQARQMMKNMERHLRNVYLGVAHQSPDYQWWHGHPALDGDLLRIKGEIGKLRREKGIIAN